MADECDIAQDMQELHLKIAIDNARGRRTCGDSQDYCEECGDEIPEARRRAIPGVRLCVSCQEEADACLS